MKETVKYLGQQINHKGISEQLIEDKIFGKIKKILFNNNYLTRFSRIRIFKCYMISKISHLLPLISLNGHLPDCWKCIRRIIFRNILRAQTSPLETAVSLGIGYYNLIIRPLIKLIEKYQAFNNNAEQYKFLQTATIKAFTYWKNLEQKLPDEVEIKLNRIINNNEWALIEEIDALIYRNISYRLFRNCKNIKQIKDPKALKYPNYIYLLSNASTHEISDTIVSKENSKDQKNKNLKWERYTRLIKMVYASNKFLDILNNEKQSYLLNKGSQSAIIEEVTILELKITNTAIDILNQDNKEIEEIIEDTETRIKTEIENNNYGLGDMLNIGKLDELQTSLRNKLSELNKGEARTFDLFWEITEGIETEKKKREKPNKGRPKKEKISKQEDNLKIENFFKIDSQIRNENMDLE